MYVKLKNTKYIISNTLILEVNETSSKKATFILPLF